MATFSSTRAIRFGFEETKKNFRFILGVMAISIALFIANQMVGNVGSEKEWGLSFVVSIVSFVVNAWISFGLQHIYLQISKNKKATYSMIFEASNLLFTYMLASLLIWCLTIGILICAALIGAVGMGFLMAKMQVAGWIIIGLAAIAALTMLVFFSIRLQFFSFILLEKKVSAMQSLKRSYAMTKGHVVHMFLFNMLLAVLNLGGLLLLGLGLFITLPLSNIASAYVYRKLLSSR